jgi:hypothetical protein
MSDDKNNVIQFPGRRNEDGKSTETAAAVPPAPRQPAKAKKRGKASKNTMAGAAIAVMLASGAVNRYAFDHSNSAELASRAPASVERLNYTRDAKWEKEVAEKLASPSVREIASTRIGRDATPHERLRWGALEEKYTINYEPENQSIQNIELQDKSSDPSYIRDRVQFLKEYGRLFQSDFKAAKLKSVESTDEKTVESYSIFDKNDKVKSEAHFELDRHKRLLSLKVQPVQI